jgi:aryl-alcohol dehydrogenase-like predicted oxidoreductase
MHALHDLVIAGKIRYLGASSMWAYQFAMMQAYAEKNGLTKFIAMQVRTESDSAPPDCILWIANAGKESLQSAVP